MLNRRLALSGTFLLTLMATQLTVPSAQAANPTCDNFDSLLQGTTTGPMACDVSATGTYTVTVTGAGGAGAGAANLGSTGGAGALVTYVLSVTAGQTLTLEVGTGGQAGVSGGGTSGRAAGGGGGWSAIKDGATLLVVAGGGGGGGTYNSVATTYTGSVPINGGNGGALGSNGTPVSTFTSGGNSISGGGGGTNSAGGTGGVGSGTFGYSGTAGSVASGGAGTFICNPPLSTQRAAGGAGWVGGLGAGGDCISSGGGGAGYFGGGGGGANDPINVGGGGGGGSSFPASATVTVATNGGVYRTNGGNGRILFSALTPTPTPTPTPAPSAPPASAQVTISLNPNGGSTAIPSVVGPAGSWVTLPDASAMTRPGYRFAGWTAGVGWSGTWYAPGSSVQLVSDTTLFAQWYVVEVDPSADPDAGSGSGSSGSGAGSGTGGTGGSGANGGTGSGSGSNPASVKRCTDRAKVYFDSMSSALTPEAKSTLSALVKETGKKGIRNEVIGFVQPVGGTGNDDSLSLARAENVAAYLKSLGLRGSYDVSGDGRAKEQGAKARRVNVTVTAVCPR